MPRFSNVISFFRFYFLFTNTKNCTICIKKLDSKKIRSFRERFRLHATTPIRWLDRSARKELNVVRIRASDPIGKVKNDFYYFLLPLMVKLVFFAPIDDFSARSRAASTLNVGVENGTPPTTNSKITINYPQNGHTTSSVN